MPSKQIEKNAAKVAGRLKHDWQNAYVIACSVELGAGNGTPLSGPTASKAPRTQEAFKVSAEEFARQIKEQAGGKVYGMGAAAIRSTLKKWNDLATDPRWNMTPSYDLTPEDADKDGAVVFPDRDWREEAGSEYVARSKDDDIKSNVAAIARAAAADPEFADEVSDAVAEAAPAAAAKVAAKAIRTDSGRKAVAAALTNPDTAKAMVKAASPAARGALVEAAVVVEAEEAGLAHHGSASPVPDPVPAWKRKIDGAVIAFDDARIVLNEIATERGDDDVEVIAGRNYYQSAIDRLWMKTNTSESLS